MWAAGIGDEDATVEEEEAQFCEAEGREVH